MAVGAGANTILVPNLPALGLIPAALLAGPAAVQGLNDLSAAFNAGLAGTLGLLQSGLGADIRAMDVFGLVNAIFADPLAFGFANLTDGCALANGGTVCGSPDEYFFWDGIHPTTLAHAIFGQEGHVILTTPIPAPFVLLASAFAGITVLGRSRRRTSAAA